MGFYIAEEEVRIRLRGKVKFTDDNNDGNAFQNSLLREFVLQAEAQVEYDLSPRYAAPFQSDGGVPFAKFLQQKPPMTLAYYSIKNMIQLQAVIRVLETDFGRGTVSNADKYIEKIEDRYKNMVEGKFLAKKKMVDGSETQQWQYPPITSLALNYHNTEADDGYMGQVLTTTQVNPEYPQFQINDPSENYWNGIFDDPSHRQGPGSNDTSGGGAGY